MNADGIPRRREFQRKKTENDGKIVSFFFQRKTTNRHRNSSNSPESRNGRFFLLLLLLLLLCVCVCVWLEKQMRNDAPSTVSHYAAAGGVSPRRPPTESVVDVVVVVVFVFFLFDCWLQEKNKQKIWQWRRCHRHVRVARRSPLD